MDIQLMGMSTPVVPSFVRIAGSFDSNRHHPADHSSHPHNHDGGRSRRRNDLDVDGDKMRQEPFLWAAVRGQLRLLEQQRLPQRLPRRQRKQMLWRRWAESTKLHRMCGKFVEVLVLAARERWLAWLLDADVADLELQTACASCLAFDAPFLWRLLLLPQAPPNVGTLVRLRAEEFAGRS
jgi:hypothetical protein